MSEENSSSICVFSNAFLQTNLQILKVSTRLWGINSTNSVVFPQSLVLLSCFILLLYCFRLNCNISKLVHSEQVISLFAHSQMFSRKERRRPHSADVSCLLSGTTDSTLTTTATHLWVPKPLSLDPDSKVSSLPNATYSPFYQEVSFIPQFQMARLLQWDNKLLLSIWTLMILSKKSKLGQKSSWWWMVIAETIFAILLHPVQCCYTIYEQHGKLFKLQCIIVAREAAGICWQCYLAFHPALLDMTCTAVFTVYILQEF